MENTLSASFKEENDHIELEKWKCCLEPNFDITLLKTFSLTEASYSLLTSVWSCSKILISPCFLDDLERERVEKLINWFLDQGDFQNALRLDTFFKNSNQVSI